MNVVKVMRTQFCLLYIVQSTKLWLNRGLAIKYAIVSYMYVLFTRIEWKNCNSRSRLVLQQSQSKFY